MYIFGNRSKIGIGGMRISEHGYAFRHFASYFSSRLLRVLFLRYTALLHPPDTGPSTKNKLFPEERYLSASTSAQRIRYLARICRLEAPSKVETLVDTRVAKSRS
jgi:hypothetical protein